MITTPHRLIWLLPVLSLLVIVIAVWAIFAHIIPLTLSLNKQFAESRDFSIESLVNSDNDSLNDLKDRLDVAVDQMDTAHEYTQWLARFSPSLALFPGTEHEISSWFIQFHRLRDDLKLSSQLLVSSSQLIDMYANVQTELTNIPSTLNTTGKSLPATELQGVFTSITTDLTRQSYSYERYKPVLRPTRIGQLMSMLTTVEGEMLIYASTGRVSSALLVDLLDISEQTQPLLSQFMSPQEVSEPLTYEDIMAYSVAIDLLVESALSRSQLLDEIVSDRSEWEDLHAKLDLLQRVLVVLRDVNRATMIGLRTVEPLLRAGEQSKGGLFSDGEGITQALRDVSRDSGELDNAQSLLRGAQKTLTELNILTKDPGNRADLSGLESIVNLLEDGFHIIGDLAPIGADLIASDSLQRYLVLGQSSDELRATGGFISAIWLVTFSNGVLTDVLYHDTVRVDDWDRLELYPKAPTGLEEHMNANVWLLRDVSWEPNYPTTARTAADMYKIGQRQKVDGVVAINQWALKTLIGALGNVEIAEGGTPVTSRNVFARLEEGSDKFGRAYIDLAFNGVLNKLKQPLSLNALVDVASAINTSLESKNILLFFNDPKIQNVVERNNWDGGLYKGGSDYLFIIDSNVGWSKTDRNIERKARYEVNMKNLPKTRVNLVLSYKNHSGPASPGCEPQWLNKGSNYNQLKNACYWNYWRVLTPQGTKLLSNAPLELPEYSVSAETGRGRPGDDTVKFSSIHNRTMISGLFELGAGETREFNLVYDLPPEILTYTGDDIHYELFIQKQPGILNREILVDLILPDGYELGSHSPTTVVSQRDSRVSFQLMVEHDTVLRVILSRTDNASD